MPTAFQPLPPLPFRAPGSRVFRGYGSGESRARDASDKPASHADARIVLPASPLTADPIARAPNALQLAPPHAARFDRHVVYGRKGAMQFACRPAGKGGPLNVHVKAAPTRRGTHGKRSVAWDQAITLSLAPHQVGLLLSASLGQLETLRLSGHGKHRGTWLKADEGRDDGAPGLRLTLAQGRRLIAVTVGSRDAIQVIGICDRAAQDTLGLEPVETWRKLQRQAIVFGLENERRQAAAASTDDDPWQAPA